MDTGRSAFSESDRIVRIEPLGGNALDPQSLNRYKYVMNNPTNWTDPSGAVAVPTYMQLMKESWGIQERSIQFGSNWNEFDVYEAQSQWLLNHFKAGQVSVTFPGYTSTSSQLYFVGNFLSPLGAVDLVYEQQVSYHVFSSTSRSGTGAPTVPRPRPPQAQAPPKTPTLSPGPPGVSPDPLACSHYLDGTGAGQILFDLCSKVFPNGPWSNCVRGELLNQYVPNGNPLDLSIYLFWDHPKDFATCAVQ